MFVNVQDIYFPQHVILKIFNPTENLKEWGNEHLYTPHLDSANSRFAVFVLLFPLIPYLSLIFFSEPLENKL